MQDYKFDIRHLDGTKMPADFISRNPVFTVYVKPEPTRGEGDVNSIYGVISLTKFIKNLKEDPDFKSVMKKMETLKEQFKREEEIELGEGKYQSYVLKPDGRLYQRMHGGKWQKNDVIDRLCIPKRYRKRILQEFHD